MKREAAVVRDGEVTPITKSWTDGLSGSLAREKITVIGLGLMMVLGLGLRATGLGRIGFAEDEINKLEAVRAYDRGDFTANAEHPFLHPADVPL